MAGLNVCICNGNVCDTLTADSIFRNAPIMLENLPIIPSNTSQNLYPKLFLIIILIILTILADLLNLSLMTKQ